MGLIITLLILGIITYTAYNIITYVIAGYGVSKFDEELYSNLKIDEMSINQFDPDKLQLPHGIGRGDNIIRVPFHLYGRYRISGMVGMVKRKSNLDKEIEKSKVE